MYTEAKKLHLIEYLLKESNESVLSKVEEILINAAKMPKNNIGSFVSTLSIEEVDEMEKIINEGCERINPDDWK
jgi:hypothetical protein